MEKLDPFIIRILLKNGFTQEEIDSLSKQEIKEIYQRGMRRMIQGFSLNTQNQEIERPKNPFSTLQEPKEIYQIPLDFFKSFLIEDIVLMLHKRFKVIPMERIQKIVKILYFAFQEELLQEIKTKLSKLPEDEQESILEIYERSDIQHLLEINQHLQSENFRKKFEGVLAIKAMLKKGE